MKFTTFLSLLCLLFLPVSTSAEEHFTREVKRKAGDLNKDGREDLVIVTQDTTVDVGPYRLQVFFKQPDGHYDLVVSTEKAINPAFPNGKDGYATGNDFDDISLDGGVLTISVQLLRGHYEHKFRYQNGNFELIGFSEGGADGGICISVDFNLSTGVRIETDEHCDTDKVIRNVNKKVMVRPLPKLQDFQPMQDELY